MPEIHPTSPLLHCTGKGRFGGHDLQLLSNEASDGFGSQAEGVATPSEWPLQLPKPSMRHEGRTGKPTLERMDSRPSQSP